MFLYADAGVNIPWRTSSFPEKYSWNNLDAYKLKNTFYGELGLGLKQLLPKYFLLQALVTAIKPLATLNKMLMCGIQVHQALQEILTTIFIIKELH